MNLPTYLNETSTKKSDFARAIKVSPALLHQWIEGIRPVAIPQCVVIERETGGKVSRKELRPDDWDKIWPDLTPDASNLTPAGQVASARADPPP